MAEVVMLVFLMIVYAIALSVLLYSVITRFWEWQERRRLRKKAGRWAYEFFNL